MVREAAEDLAGLGASLGDATVLAAGPTTRVVPAAADEVSAAISAMFAKFGQEFQGLSAQARAFHAEFVKLMNTSAGAYAGAEIANAEQAVANVVNASGGAGAAQSVSAAGLLGGILGGGTSGGGLLGGLTGTGGLLGGLGSLGGVVGSLGNLGSLGSNLGTLLTSAVPGLPTSLGSLTNSLTPVVNSLLPGLLNVQAGAGPYFTGIAGPYEALVYNTVTNLQSLVGGWFADPFPFLRQVAVNQMGYGQTIATAFQTGDFQPVTAIPGHIAQNIANVVGTLTNTGVTSSLVVQSLTVPTDVTLNNAVGLPLVFAASLMGPPAATMEAAGYSAATFAAAVQAGDAAGAFAALVDAPAVIANGFLNGQATFPCALNLSSITGPAIGNIANVTVVANIPLDGILHAPGYYPVTATVTLLGNTVLPAINVNLGVGSTPFSGLLPFLVNYAPQQLAQAIGAPVSPPPLLSITLPTF
ncbi:hypothetical protein A5706_30450 [Mycobacterium sp. E796]|nr:hypothetical protein A5706_30450 [Mycobacterium sp. E796]